MSESETKPAAPNTIDNPFAGVKIATNKSALAAKQDLIFDDLLRGGDDGVTAVTVEGIAKDGQPGTLYFIQPPARDVLDFAEAPSTTPEEIRERNKMPFLLAAKTLASRDGRRLIPAGEESRIYEMPLVTLTKVVGALMTVLGITQTDDEVKAATEEAKAQAEGRPVSEEVVATPLGKG